MSKRRKIIMMSIIIFVLLLIYLDSHIIVQTVMSLFGQNMFTEFILTIFHGLVRSLRDLYFNFILSWKLVALIFIYFLHINFKKYLSKKYS